ncbi:carbohydrate sulfotransferase 1-like [Mya arenaria]|uniref:carbohydrate sulfotransferase 1-like n=1 Tax=Mya arenaria TaxID=6604 RepID=UPI0022E19538|nr:carbohydrate sulfotransferase 1-like [Mya arenaria]
MTLRQINYVKLSLALVWIFTSILLIAKLMLVADKGGIHVKQWGLLNKGTSSRTMLRSSKKLHSSSKTVNEDFTPVIIVAYPRSGSTLLGNIVQKSTDVFYVFEPLWALHEHFFNNTSAIRGHNLEFRRRRPSMTMKYEADTIFRAWLTCNTSTLVAKEYRVYKNFLPLGLKTNAATSECLDSIDHPICRAILRRECLKSKIRVIKTIRTPIDWLYNLMEEFPTLKILHLVRDPRATANSLWHFDFCGAEDYVVNKERYVKCLQYLCEKMDDDVLSFRIMKEKYKERVHRIYFEDLAMNPNATSRKLYETLGIHHDKEIENYVHMMTNAKEDSVRPLGTYRKNSRLEIDKWKEQLSDSALYTIQTLCHYSMKNLGYKTIYY